MNEKKIWYTFFTAIFQCIINKHYSRSACFKEKIYTKPKFGFHLAIILWLKNLEALSKPIWLCVFVKNILNNSVHHNNLMQTFFYISVRGFINIRCMSKIWNSALYILFYVNELYNLYLTYIKQVTLLYHKTAKLYITKILDEYWWSQRYSNKI